MNWLRCIAYALISNNIYVSSRRLKGTMNMVQVDLRVLTSLGGDGVIGQTDVGGH